MLFEEVTQWGQFKVRTRKEPCICLLNTNQMPANGLDVFYIHVHVCMHARNYTYIYVCLWSFCLKGKETGQVVWIVQGHTV